MKLSHWLLLTIISCLAVVSSAAPTHAEGSITLRTITCTELHGSGVSDAPVVHITLATIDRPDIAITTEDVRPWSHAYWIDLSYSITSYSQLIVMAEERDEAGAALGMNSILFSVICGPTPDVEGLLPSGYAMHLLLCNTSILDAPSGLPLLAGTVRRVTSWPIKNKPVVDAQGQRWSEVLLGKAQIPGYIPANCVK